MSPASIVTPRFNIAIERVERRGSVPVNFHNDARFYVAFGGRREAESGGTSRQPNTDCR